MPGLVPKQFGKVDECIVIFLNDRNLNILKGYKAEILKEQSALPDTFGRKHASITITITGLSNKGATDLQDALTEMNPQELTEYLKLKFTPVTTEVESHE
jgi:hypothetical protein